MPHTGKMRKPILSEKLVEAVWNKWNEKGNFIRKVGGSTLSLEL